MIECPKASPDVSPNMPTEFHYLRDARARAAATALLALSSLVGCAGAASAASDEAARPYCFEQLENATTPEISCAVPLDLSETERAELEAGSRGYVKNVACTLTVRIARREVEAALAATDIEFQSPEQPVVCHIETHKSGFDVTATFAPRFVVRGDVAVEATPGLGNVKGVSRVISWPVVQFVNRWPSIRSGLLQIVNAYRVHSRKRKASR